jgi:hypothetical protein
MHKNTMLNADSFERRRVCAATTASDVTSGYI